MMISDGKSNKKDIIEYLKNKNKIRNIDFINEVEKYTGLKGYNLFAIHNENNISGVSSIAKVNNKSFDFFSRIEANDEKAVEHLIKMYPASKNVCIRVQNCEIQKYLNDFARILHVDTYIYFLLTQKDSSFKKDPDVIELTKNKIHLFKERGEWAKNELFNKGLYKKRAFAILNKGEIASSVAVSSMIIDKDKKESIYGITSLYTEKEFRRKGFAKRLLFHVAYVFLQNNGNLLYYTQEENSNSIAFAKSIGFKECFIAKDYIC